MRPPLYLLRHGETEWNKQLRLQGSLDSDLTLLGIQQAHQQAAILKTIIQSPITAYCSPLGRARKTAEIAIAPFGAKPIIDTNLAEIGLGKWEGRTWDDIRARYPEVTQPKASFAQSTQLADGGEGLQSLMTRCTEFLDGLTQPSIVVSHGVTISALRGILLGLSVGEIDQMDHPQGVVIEICNATETIHKKAGQ